MTHSLVAERNSDVARRIGASDVLVYRRASGGRFVLTGPQLPGVTGELLLDDEPRVTRALRVGVVRVAAEEPIAICGGYAARSAAIVAVDPDVIVVLGRRNGCLAGVSDATLVAAAGAAALAQADGV